MRCLRPCIGGNTRCINFRWHWADWFPFWDCYFLSATPSCHGCCSSINTLQSKSCFDLVTQKYQHSTTEHSRAWWCHLTRSLSLNTTDFLHPPPLPRVFSPSLLVPQTLHFHLKIKTSAQNQTCHLLCLLNSSISDIPTESSAI